MSHDATSTVGTIGEGISAGTRQWHSMAVVIWLTGAFGMLVVNIIRTALFLRRLRSDAVVPDISVERLVRRLSHFAGLRRPPHVVISKGNVGPAVFGVMRPTIILPLALVHDCRPRQLTPIVLHELIHVRRGDLWLALHSMLVRAIWWFHPLVWWSVRRAEWESERCCDESVVARMQRDPARYAHSLIGALTQSHRLQSVSFAPGVRPAHITAARVERVMNLRHGSHRRMPMSCWIVALLAAALVLPGAAGSPAQPPDTDKTVDQPALPGTDVAPNTIDPDAPATGFEEVSKAKNPERNTTRIYDAADLLKKMKAEQALPQDASDESVKLALVSLLQVLSPEMGAAVRQPNAAWYGDKLIVPASAAVHESLAKAIELRRRYGFRQVVVEVRIMQADPRLCMSSDSDTEVAGEPLDWPNRWILFQQEYANIESQSNDHTIAAVSLNSGIPNPPRDDVAGQRAANEPGRPAAAAWSGTSDPIVYQFVSDRQMRSFVNELESDARANIILAPRVTLFNGQTALITDTSQRPFVTDVDRVVGDDGVAYQPVIKVLWEGTKIQLSPAITPDGCRMTCRFMFAAIKDCKQFRPSRYPDAKDTRIQHPVAATSTFECSIDIPAGQTLVIGGLFPSEREYDAEPSMLSRLLGQTPKKVVRKEMTYIAITPRTLEPEMSLGPR